MSGTSWSEVFPTRNSFLIFIGYMSLFVSQGLIIILLYIKKTKYRHIIIDLCFIQVFWLPHLKTQITATATIQ